MAKGYDPEKYINDLTNAITGIDDWIKKVDEKITKAKDTQKSKDEAAAKAKKAVEDLEAEKARLTGNRSRAAATLATAKGEDVAQNGAHVPTFTAVPGPADETLPV